MNQVRSSSAPFPKGEDVSYHYLYGRHQLCRYLPPADLCQPVPEPGSEYDLVTQRATGQRSNDPQTVEQLITRGYLAVPAAAPETALLSDKRATAWMGLDDLIHQARHRIVIYRQNLYEIEWAKCRATNDLLAWEANHGWPASAEQQYQLGKRMDQLYTEQRAERVAVWRDVSRLRQSFPESAQQYLTAQRKMEILEDPEEGGGP